MPAIGPVRKGHVFGAAPVAEISGKSAEHHTVDALRVYSVRAFQIQRKTVSGLVQETDIRVKVLLVCQHHLQAMAFGKACQPGQQQKLQDF